MKHDIGHGDVVIAAITSLHQHLQPGRADRRRPRRPQGAGAGPRFQALGEDQPRAGHRRWSPIISTRPGSQRGSQRDRLRSGRLWLHHLHRQFRAAAGGDQRLDPQERRGRRLGAVRQPQFRGPRLARRARQLSRLAAARRRLCAQGHGDRGHGVDADRQGQRRHRRLSQGHLAVERGGPLVHRRLCPRRHVPRPLRQRL